MTGTTRAGRLSRLAAALALLALGCIGRAGPVRADEPAKEMTEEERGKLEEEAKELYNQTVQLYQDGKYAAATESAKESLSRRRKLYPADKYPGGHPDLATSLDNLGVLLDERGEYGQAELLFRDALAMRQKLYPADKYPGGHPDLATSLDNLGVLLDERGEYGQAEPYYRDALEMKKKLYPADKFPDGHPDLARSLNNLGVLLYERGECGKAEPLLREALAMRRKLYPADKFPAGHPDVVRSLNNLGGLLHERGECGKAEPLLREALAMRRMLYPADKYPGGHPDLALSLSNLGELLRERGEYGEAEPFFRDALEMRKKLYPPDSYPAGHPDLALSLSNLGILLHARGEYGEAADVQADASSMYDRLAAVFARAGAEAEALNFAATLPGARSAFLAASSHEEADRPVTQYAVLWQGKSALGRAQQQRRRLLQAAARADEAARRKLQALTDTRQDLARLLLAPAPAGDADRDKLLRELTDRKERLEKELAGVLPASDRETPPYDELTHALPDRAAFLDFYRYQDYDLKANKWAAAHYAVFVLRNGRAVRRVELADGDAIDKDLAEWRNDVINNLRGDAAGRLRQNLWRPVAAALGDGVDAVYVCPDGPLGALPWPAMPGAEPSRVLLEEYAFALVPSGPFLLEQLTRPADPKREAGALVAVGGVAYGRGDMPGGPWKRLPATDKESKDVVKEAKGRPQISKVVGRTGAEATVARLVQDLPKARWAHLATHGFFAAPESQEREHLFRPGEFLLGAGGDRQGAAARNPLTLSGVVLAGANQPTETDTGLLTGEAIAGLDLDGLDLAVLSACQTGLGEQLSGEGVFGLQRAFHIAGATNVVASLWTVDDDATAALMNLFYYHLWEKDEPPLEALHHAQLELYRNPQGVPALARGRGAADWDETVQAVTKPAADPNAAPKRAAAVKDWAAFVLSGAGR